MGMLKIFMAIHQCLLVLLVRVSTSTLVERLIVLIVNLAQLHAVVLAIAQLILT